MGNNLLSREWILHIDGDAFFASVEVSRRPDLFGKPVVVGEERGIATALTYPAKALGVKRGDPIFKIKKEFPQVIILSSHFELYRRFAHNLAEILIPLVDDFEAYSIDECFATLSGTVDEVQEKVKRLKILVQKKLGITYSFGVSTTKTLSKVASKRNKPNGICFLMDDIEITKALQTTKAESIWGVGWAINKKLQRYKIETAYQFINSDLKEVLRDSYTKPVALTKDELCGNQHFKVGGENAHKKSIQSTRTFLNKTNIKKTLYGELSRNVEIACSQMREQGLVTKHISYFLIPKEKGQRYIDASVNLPNYTNSDITVMKFIEHSFDKLICKDKVMYKKSGVIMMGLERAEDLQPDLFGTQESINIEEDRITRLIDGIRNKYGFGILGLASSLDVNNNRGKDHKRRHIDDNYISGLPFAFLGITS
jgi:DNA polymerase-4/DNA polymerase V